MLKTQQPEVVEKRCMESSSATVIVVDPAQAQRARIEAVKAASYGARVMVFSDQRIADQWRDLQGL